MEGIALLGAVSITRQPVGQGIQFPAQLVDGVVDIDRHQEAAVLAGGISAAFGHGVVEDPALFIGTALPGADAVADRIAEGADILVGRAHFLPGFGLGGGLGHGGQAGLLALLQGVVGALQRAYALVHVGNGSLLGFDVRHRCGRGFRGQLVVRGRDLAAQGRDLVPDLLQIHFCAPPYVFFVCIVGNKKASMWTLLPVFSCPAGFSADRGLHRRSGDPRALRDLVPLFLFLLRIFLRRYRRFFGFFRIFGILFLVRRRQLQGPG